ncbi:ankyrin repeat domain-containing protein 6-like isoform X1 [Antennarius striatus]|uniref:ankyrin repeat domain-containing protein 6-like isoform X1 n=1 Tax=Antennarius striatus TaxID=241820 RepID=UPI0035B4754B
MNTCPTKTAVWLQVGDTCLHVAARYDNVTLVKILLGFLCPVTDRNQVGDTALHVAAALNHKRTVQVLLEAGADGTVRNNAGKSALDKARDHNHKQVYLLLTRVPQNRSPVKEEPPSSEQTESRASVGKVVSDWQHKHQNQSSNETPAVITNCHSHKRKKRVKAQLRALNEDILSKVTNDLIRDGGDHKSSQNGTAYQLRTLYCDRNGDIQQATANGCYCKPALEKLEARLKVTQEEMRMQLLKIQEQVNSRLGKIDRSIRHQTIMNHELKRYRVSQLKDIPVHIPVKAQYYKLLPSPSVQPSVNLDLESQPLLSVVSGDSSASLATYINILPSKSVHSVGGPEQDQLGGRMYFEMKMNRSSDDYENTALFPVAENNSSLHLGSVGACGNEMKQSSAVAVLPPCREGVFSRQSSISDHGARVHHNEHSYDMKARSQVIAHRLAEIHTDSNRKLDFFSDQAAKSTFNQERNNLHAQEVTQLFFETVSAQLELWYERKIVEVEQQTELRAQQDRKELLLQISMLEEELQGLKTNKKEES